MTVITQIKPQRNKRRVNIYLDEKFAFGLDLENFVKIGLKVGQELSEKEIEDIIKKNEYAKTLDKLLRFTTLRPRSISEVELWYKKHKVHKSLQKKLFNKLKHLELIDDEKFAHWWVEQRLQFKPKSKRELIFELRNKGIAKEIIENTLSSLDINEEKHAKSLLKKRNYKWQKMENYQAKHKMYEYLSRRGFGWDVIKKVVDSFLKNE